MILQIILAVCYIYLLCGFVFALVFIISGVEKIDDAAIGSSFGFKMIIIPGAMILWPVLWRKWLQANNKK